MDGGARPLHILERAVDQVSRRLVISEGDRSLLVRVRQLGRAGVPALLESERCASSRTRWRLTVLLRIIHIS